MLSKKNFEHKRIEENDLSTGSAHQGSESPRRGRWGAGLVACAAAIWLGGCGGDAPGAAGLETTSRAVTIRNPDVPYFVNIYANGTGCPQGSWDANIDPSGETFTITFSQYEATISPGQLLSVKDCQLGVDLHSPSGLSYSIAEFYYSGYAFLDQPGMRARQTARYYFQGNPVNSADGRTEVTGPFDDEYVYRDTIGVADLVWSPCGTQRLLNIQTRILAQNNGRRTGTGYINTLAADATLVLQFRLAWRSCH